MFQEMFNDRDGIRIEEIVEIPQDAKEIGWPSFKQEDSTFYFVRNHFESIGKPILLKGGKVLLVNKMLIRAQVIVTKNTHKLFHKILSKVKYPKSVQPTLSTRCHRFPNSDRH